ncbi:MAG: hypothetical protein VB086_10655 [Clostridiaceae bacterium]|nr:hypothetical protein [Clostridiaceae bacterium]
MASPYVITITDGVGTENIVQATYTVTATVTGYNDLSILPATQTITAAGTYGFTIAATGTLTLHVTVEGTDIGTPIVGATFARCDSGSGAHGSEVTTDGDGNAVFPYVPFDATTPPSVYYRQTASDGDHDFDATLQTTTLTLSGKIIEIANPVPGAKTINLTDVNYTGLPIEDGTLTLT